MRILYWLEQWYKSSCNTDWEHVYGVKINTLDNPGWGVMIDLSYTPLEGKEFDKISVDNGEEDWIMCRVVNSVYEGAGDPLKLEEILRIFKEWAETQK